MKKSIVLLAVDVDIVCKDYEGFPISETRYADD
jgi:hypothetical protein